MSDENLSTDSLTAIPLALAGWLRYLLGVDDDLNEMAVSSDPLLEDLTKALKGVRITDGEPRDCGEILRPILSNKHIFGVDLYEAGLAGRITGMFEQMLRGKGAVRALLAEYFPSRG
jgi:fructuronate reductase